MRTNNRKEHYLLDVLIILLLSFASIIILPYQFGIEDQAVYIPIIEKGLNPELFKTDYLVNTHGETTLFFPLIKLLIFIFKDISAVFLVTYFLTLFLFFLGVYLLSLSLFNNRITAILSVLLFFFPKWIGGTGTKTYENYLVPRFLASPLILFSLIALVKNKLVLASLFISLTFLVHPVSGITLYFIFLALYFFLKPKTNLITVISSVVLLLIPPFIVYLLAKQQAIETTKYLIMPNQWLSLAMKRDYFVFPQLWKIRSFGSLLIFYFFYLLFIIKEKINKRIFITNIKTNRFLNIIAIVCLLLPIFVILVSQFFPLTLLIQLELARSLVIFSFIALICWAYLSSQVLRSKLSTTVKIITLFILLTSIIWNNNKAEIFDNDWIATQLWVRENTPSDSVFLTNPYSKGFRIFSQRTIVGEYKDGGPLLFSFEYAKQWSKRMDDIKNFDLLTEDDFRKLKQSYNFDYLVYNSKNGLEPLNFQKIYSNKSYTVYLVETLTLNPH